MTEPSKTYVPIIDEYTIALLEKFMPQLKFIEVKAIEVEDEENLILVTPKNNKKRD